jgi:hypothetical protein
MLETVNAVELCLYPELKPGFSLPDTNRTMSITAQWSMLLMRPNDFEAPCPQMLPLSFLLFIGKASISFRHALNYLLSI